MVSVLQRRFVVTDGSNLHFVSVPGAKEAITEVTGIDNLHRWNPKGMDGIPPDWYVAPVTDAQEAELSVLPDTTQLGYVQGLSDLSGYRQM